MPRDSDLRGRVEAALAPMMVRPIDVTVDDGVVYLKGTVRSGIEKEQAGRMVARVRGVRKVENDLEIGEVAPMRLNVAGRPMQDADWQELEEEEPAIEPDLNDDIGTTDVMESGSENEPMFPPTDPVVFPTTREEEGIVVVGGFAPTSEDDASDAEDHPPQVYHHTDDEIAEDVRRALRRDAGTASMILSVGVRNGIAYIRGRVQSLEDVEQVEAVAAEVPGVVEVREELEIA